MKRAGLLGFLAGMSVLFGIIAPAQAQSAVTLTLAVPSFALDLYETDILPDFEAQNPGVRVHLITTEAFGSPFSMDDAIDSYLDDVAAYVGEADVLPLNSADINSEVTRAGYLLDLAPFINADATLDRYDFYTAAWQSFQWDGGNWALPIAADAVLLFYDPAIFDEVGLSYPTADWTLSDLDYAVRRLAAFDASGATTRPGLVAMNAPLESLVASLVGHGFTDPASFPAQPDFSDPNIAAFLDTYYALQTEGYLTPNFDSEIEVTNPLELTRATFGGFRIGGRGFAGQGSGNTVASLLPGGGAGLIVDGFGISSGTRYPAESYALIKFISENPSAANTFVTGTPVRRSQQGIAQEAQGGPGANMRLGTFLDDATQALLIEAMESGTPTSEWLFGNVIDKALSDMRSNGTDGQAALETLAVDQIDRLNVADGRYPPQIVVAEPPAEVVLAPGEVALNFAVVGQGGGNRIQNADVWQAAIEAFVASDPQVGAVYLDAANPFDSIDTIAQTYDCFYGASNLLDGQSDVSMFMVLDPLMSADATFDPNNLVNGTLALLQTNGYTYGLPISLQPLVMRYDPLLFQNAGTFEPFNGWTVAEFEQVLRALKSANPDDYPYEPRDFGASYLYLLFAAYGGIPIDYRTSPPTLDFASPTSVEAIRQVLNLINDGLVNYSSLLTPGGGRMAFGGGGQDDLALYSQSLNSPGGFGMGAFGRQNDPNAQNATVDPMVLFPAGTQYNGAAFGVSAAHISAYTQNVEPCYRFIRSLMTHSDLITSMPATRSLLDDSTFAASQSQAAIDFYRTYDQLIGQMNTIVFPSTGARGINVNDLDAFWLGRVLDEYIAAGGDYDLAASLADAQQDALDFRDCTVLIPPLDLNQDDPIQYVAQFLACAVKVDPTTAAYLPTFGN